VNCRQEFERDLMRKRCEEGIGRAKRKGVTFGRKRKLDNEMVRVAAERYAENETMAELAEVYRVSETDDLEGAHGPFRGKRRAMKRKR
jgi:DNA invertase Pin-like site-specific DNA recombinase